MVINQSKANTVKKKFKIINNNFKIDIEPFEVKHGMIKATGYLFDKIAYISDCNYISKSFKKINEFRFFNY